MNTQVVQADEAAINRARAHAAQHRIGEAEAAYREILKTAPDTPEALNFVAMCELSRGEFAAAQARLEHASQLNPEEPEIWKNIGIVHLAQHQSGEALDAFDRALGMEPMHFASRLHKGAALEQMGRVDDATVAYFGAIAAAQGHGKWRNDVTTPPGLRAAVRHAIQFVDANRKRIFMEALQPLRDQYGQGSLARIEKGLEIYLGEREPEYPDPRQFCKFFYVPGIEHRTYYPRERFPWYEELEAQTDVIREEFLEVMKQPIGFEPFLGTNDNKVLKEQNLLDGTRGHAEWNSFFFYRHGDAFEGNQKRCPKTMAAVAKTTILFIREHSPEALYSVLTPGGHILKHHGVTNTRLVTHLSLIMPGDSAISVGGEDHSWEEGRCVTFDDTFEHESWNRSDKVRVNLMFDVWHPDLTEAERAAMTLLVGTIGDFNRHARVDAPPTD